MKSPTGVVGVLIVAVAISGCVSTESSEPAPQAFTDCVRHFNDDHLTGPDGSAAMRACEPFLDEENEALRRLAKKHFPG